MFKEGFGCNISNYQERSKTSEFLLNFAIDQLFYSYQKGNSSCGNYYKIRTRELKRIIVLFIPGPQSREYGIVTNAVINCICKY